MSDKNDKGRSGDRTTTKMEARELHLHVLELVLPTEWTRITPKFWTKDRDSLETYEALVDGYKLHIELKSDRTWLGRLEQPDGTRVETDSFDKLPQAARALVALFDQARS